MKIEGFESEKEARQALALAVAGVVAVMLLWNVLMLVFY